VAGTIKITADTAQAERDLKRLQDAIAGLDRVSGTASKALGLVAAAATAMGYAVLKTLESAGQLIDTAENLGIAAQNLQVMQHAAALTGVSADELNGVLYKLQKNIGEALITGAGAGADALDRLNIPVKEIAALRPDEQYKRIASSLAGISNPAEKSALAMDLFGKQGAKVLRMADNMAHAEEEMRKLGLALTDVDIAGLDMAGDSIDELKGLVSDGLKKAFAELSPYIIAIVENIKSAVAEAGGFPAVLAKIKAAFVEIANIIAITALVFTLSTAASMGLRLAAAIKAAGSAMALFNMIVMRNPLMLAVGAALVLAKVLGLDVTEAMADYLGMTGKTADATKSIADRAEEIAAANKQNIVVSDELNKKQKEALKQYDESINKLREEITLEREKLTLSEAEANANKMIAEQTRKLAEAKLTITDAQKSEILGLNVQLDQQKKVTAEVERQKGVVKGLADAYQTTLTKALKDFADATSRNADMQERLAKKQTVSVQEYIDNTYGKVQAEQNLKAAVLDIVNKGAGERFAIETKYDKQTEELMNKRQMLEQQFGITRAQFTAAVVNAEIAKENELYALKVKLANDEVALKSQTYARLMSENDAFYLKTIGGEKAVQEAAKQRAEFEAKTMYEKTQIGIEQGAQLFSALGAQNQKAFEAAKALNIASAIMNTYASVTKALAAYPWPFSLIPAGAALAMGLAQVSQIRSQTYSGRALGGPVMGGKSYMVGENGPELFTPQGTGSITRNGDLSTGQPTNINFTIQANDAQGFDQLLVQRRSMVTQMVRDAMAENGQRMKI
jgi:hypothetical protein